MLGRADARLGEHQVKINVEQIYNPRAADNLSGSLSLELWATREPYRGGGFAGHWLAGVALGQLGGGNEWRNAEFNLDLQDVPAGGWSLVLMLREWTAQGFVTRDYRVLPPLLARTGTAEVDPAVSINESSEAELAQVKGLNAKLAKLIVAGRPYQELSELVKVRGIGERMVNKLRSLLRL